MNRMLQMMIFLTVFVAIYAALNSYVVLRLASMLKFGQKWWLFGMIAFLTLGFPLATIIENMLPNIMTRVIYTISAFWMGMMMFFVFTLLLYEVVRLVVKLDTKIAGLTIIVFVVIVSIISAINAFGVTVKHLELPIEGLKDDIKIAQLSDIHIGTIRNGPYLDKIAKKVNELDPDIVVITGDLVDGSAPLEPHMFDELNKVKGRIFFVNGNHEVYEGVDKVYDLVRDTKIRILTNEVVSFDGIQMIGINYSESRSHVKEVLSGLDLNKTKPTVLLYHQPTEMKSAAEHGVDVMLSGHTHWGQIFPFNLFTYMVYRQYKGLYNIDGMYLYVSPGTGTWGPYMRLGSKNEITCVTLKKE